MLQRGRGACVPQEILRGLQLTVLLEMSPRRPA
jgi:hypothetical protein